MKFWPLPEANLSELVTLSNQHGPQGITADREEVAVILSKKDYDRLKEIKSDFVAFMQNSPLKNLDLEIKRNTSKPRKGIIF